jgi:hypothetical protein
LNLVPGKFRLRELAGNDNCSAGRVYLNGVLKGEMLWKNKQFPQHLDDVIVGMFVVIEQNDMIQGRMNLLFRGSSLGLYDGRGSCALHLPVVSYWSIPAGPFAIRFRAVLRIGKRRTYFGWRESAMPYNS